jgi:hypothetical protein
MSRIFGPPVDRSDGGRGRILLIGEGGDDDCDLDTFGALGSDWSSLLLEFRDDATNWGTGMARYEGPSTGDGLAAFPDSI